MLCLTCASNPEWIAVATANPDLILIDHAHCERKAAAFAITMTSRYPDRHRLVREMIALAIEELEHFALVMTELETRGLVLTSDSGNAYAQGLHSNIRSTEPDRLLDFLVVGAFIEARSCERFSLLAEHAPTKELRTLYRNLLASEAGHYRAYTDLAREYVPASDVKQRLVEFSKIEADIVKGLTNQPTMHG